jgi:hypothetical protein
MPVGAEVLSVQTHGDGVYFWVMVDPDADEERERWFESRLTGERHDYNVSDRYIGTVQLNGGEYVLHYFEIKR